MVTPSDSAEQGTLEDLEGVFRAHHAFVWRSLVHLGLPGPTADDALQDVFLVVHRRIGHFDGRTSLRNWLYGIARRVASEYRRGTRRAIRTLHVVPDPDIHAAPDVLSSRVSAAEQVRRILDEIDADKREVFILAELEGMTAVEIAEALGLNVNTVYGRLRAARQRFARVLKRVQAEEARLERRE
ncbi:MAG: RNA polymerase sigma factor [Nannocystaceae bacterium]|nr:RNA polymerase sigma factor [bacterium]